MLGGVVMSGNQQTTATQEWRRQQIDAALASAWIARCGPTGTPGDWWAGEVLDLLDDDIEVTVSPSWKIEGEGGHAMWSRSFRGRDGAVHCWEWQVNLFGDDLSDAECDALDALDVCWDDRGFSLTTEGDSQVRPEVPEALANAVALLLDGPPGSGSTGEVAP